MVDSEEGSDGEGWGGVVEARGGVEGSGAWVAVPSGRSEEENQTFYIFLFVCLFVCFAFVKGDKLREGLLTATTCL